MMSEMHLSNMVLSEFMKGWWSCLNSIAEDAITMKDAIESAGLTTEEMTAYIKSDEYCSECLRQVLATHYNIRK